MTQHWMKSSKFIVCVLRLSNTRTHSWQKLFDLKVVQLQHKSKGKLVGVEEFLQCVSEALECVVKLERVDVSRPISVKPEHKIFDGIKND